MPTKTASNSATSSAAAAAASMREQILQGVRQSQQIAIDAAAGWAELASKAMPASSSFPTIPGTPTAADLQDAVAASFGLVQELVSAQQSFVEQLLAAVLPATPTSPSA